jgi:hypothetical protein
MVIDDFKHASVAQSSKGLGKGSFETALSIPDRTTDPPPNLFRKLAQVSLTAANPAHRLGRFSL